MVLKDLFAYFQGVVQSYIEKTPCSLGLAQVIKWRILHSNRFDCQLRKQILQDVTKITSDFLETTHSTKPCKRTNNICLKADHFFQIEILSSLDFENIFANDNFTKHADHKNHLIRYILNEYERIKGVNEAKTSNFKENQVFVRHQLTKLIFIKDMIILSFFSIFYIKG